MTKTDK